MTVVEERTMSSAVLRQMIRDQLDSVDEPDLWDVTRKVVALIDPSDYVDALEITLRSYVKDFVGERRRDAFKPVIQDPGQLPEPQTTTATTSRGPSRRSVAVAAWRRRLDVLVQPNPGDSRPKRLGACTIGDFKMLAGLHARAARDNQAQADWYMRIAEAMNAVKAKTMADLPENTLRPLLEKVAAA